VPRLTRSGGLIARVRLGGGLAVGQFVGRGALALALLLLVRYLPPAEFATLALALAILSIMSTLADAGFARLLVRDTARAGAASHHVVSELLRVRLRAVAGAAVGAALILAWGPGHVSASFVALASAYLVSESIAFGYENAAAGAERPLRFVAAQGLSALWMLGGLAWLIGTDGVSLPSAMAVLASASLLKAGAHVAAWRGGSSAALSEEPVRTAAELFREALPFLGLAVLAAVYYRVGVIALYSLRGPSETASFAAASRVVDAVAVIAAVTFLSASPGFSRMHRDHPERIWSTWRRKAGLTAVVAAPVAVLVGLAAEPICAGLFGEAYRSSAADDLRLMLPGAALMVVQGISGAVVFMSDDHGAVVRLTVVNVTACVALTFGLSAGLGSQGAALALTLAEVLSVITFALLIRRRHRATAADAVVDCRPCATTIDRSAS